MSKEKDNATIFTSMIFSNNQLKELVTSRIEHKSNLLYVRISC